jgi:hypothetical protein
LALLLRISAEPKPQKIKAHVTGTVEEGMRAELAARIGDPDSEDNPDDDTDFDQADGDHYAMDVDVL